MTPPSLKRMRSLEGEYLQFPATDADNTIFSPSMNLGLTLPPKTQNSADSESSPSAQPWGELDCHELWGHSKRRRITPDASMPQLNPSLHEKPQSEVSDRAASQSEQSTSDALQSTQTKSLHSEASASSFKALFDEPAAEANVCLEDFDLDDLFGDFEESTPNLSTDESATSSPQSSVKTPEASKPQFLSLSFPRALTYEDEAQQDQPHETSTFCENGPLAQPSFSAPLPSTQSIVPEKAPIRDEQSLYQQSSSGSTLQQTPATSSTNSASRLKIEKGPIGNQKEVSYKSSVLLSALIGLAGPQAQASMNAHISMLRFGSAHNEIDSQLNPLFDMVRSKLQHNEKFRNDAITYIMGLPDDSDEEVFGEYLKNDEYRKDIKYLSASECRRAYRSLEKRLSTAAKRVKKYKEERDEAIKELKQYKYRLGLGRARIQKGSGDEIVPVILQRSKSSSCQPSRGERCNEETVSMRRTQSTPVQPSVWPPGQSDVSKQTNSSTRRVSSTHRPTPRATGAAQMVLPQDMQNAWPRMMEPNIGGTIMNTTVAYPQPSVMSGGTTSTTLQNSSMLPGGMYPGLYSHQYQPRLFSPAPYSSPYGVNSGVIARQPVLGQCQNGGSISMLHQPGLSSSSQPEQLSSDNRRHVIQNGILPDTEGHSQVDASSPVADSDISDIQGPPTMLQQMHQFPRSQDHPSTIVPASRGLLKSQEQHQMVGSDGSQHPPQDQTRLQTPSSGPQNLEASPSLKRRSPTEGSFVPPPLPSKRPRYDVGVSRAGDEISKANAVAAFELGIQRSWMEVKQIPLTPRQQAEQANLEPEVIDLTKEPSSSLNESEPKAGASGERGGSYDQQANVEGPGPDSEQGLEEEYDIDLAAEPEKELREDQERGLNQEQDGEQEDKEPEEDSGLDLEMEMEMERELELALELELEQAAEEL